MTQASIKHLPDAAAGIAAKQGWTNDTIIQHLIGYLQDNHPETFEKGLELYFGHHAEEENGFSPDVNSPLVLR